MSDDGKSAVVLIAMLGNVFSPRWARARARGDARVRSLDYSAVNVAVHGQRRSRWAMTERCEASVLRGPDDLAIGATRLQWEGDELVALVDERTAPWGRPLRGTIRFRPDVRTSTVVDLDPRGRHQWFPHAPVGRIAVDFAEPRLRFEGHGYFDANAGREPLEAAFASWSWSRLSTDDRIALAYDVVHRDGTRGARGVLVHGSGETEPYVTGGECSIGRTRFGLPRTLRTESGAEVELLRTLEDGPFYARSLVRTTLGGRPAVGMHEAVSLDRFSSRWVQLLLPFRMRIEGAP